MPVSGNLHFLKSVHDDANRRSLSCEYSGYNSYIRCLNKDKIKYPVLPVLDCDAYQEN